MIKRVTLSKWKAFEHLDLELPAGTSFIVARNGVGKTSLLQALHFGLFGNRRLLASGTGVEHAVRGGSSARGSVTLEIDLGGDSWIIRRDVPGSLRPDDSLPSATATKAGEAVPETEWQLALAESAGVGLSELQMLAAIGEGATISSRDASSNGQYNLVHHLSDVLGVSRLRDAAEQLRQSATLISSAADRERLTLRDRPQRSNAGEQERLLAEQGELQNRLPHLRESLQDLEMRRSVRASWGDFRTKEARFKAETLAMLERAQTRITEGRSALESALGSGFRSLSSAIDSNNEPSEMITDLQSELSDLISDVRNRRDSEVRTAGALDARISAIDTALALLTSATAICPTCKQPLSPDAAEEAREAHLLEKDSLLAELADVQTRSSEFGEAIEVLLGLADIRVPSYPASPAGPPLEDLDDPDQAAELTIRGEIRDLTQRLQDIEASLRLLANEAERRASDAALSKRLTTQYRHADLSMVSANAFEQLADSICRERINPLSQMLEKRWSELWPGRPTLTLDFDTGDLIGQVAGTQLSREDLSGGERAVALILLRLLALQSASNSPVLLMDEPLEHLDPRNRRMLAGLLVAATGGSPDIPPRQLLVTTYEESVTRRLDRQMGDHGSHVVYVTTDAESSNDA